MKYERDDFGDVSITLDRVIITHLDQWSNTKSQTFLRRNSLDQRALDSDSFVSSNMEEISEAKVTFHR